MASAIVIRAPAGLSVIYGSNTTDRTGKASEIWTLGSRAGPDTLLTAVTQSGSEAVAEDTVYATAHP